jgi:hypothetical protein
LSWAVIGLSFSLSIDRWKHLQQLEIRDKSQYANDNEINSDKIIKYLGENHDNDAENKRDNTPP